MRSFGQHTVTIGKHHGTTADIVVDPLVHVVLNFLCRSRHDRFQQLRFYQYLYGLIGGRTLINPAARIPAGTTEHSLESHEFHAPVSIAGMGIHDAHSQFDEFPPYGR